ncbi:MAG: CvpA family protein [Candidatus Symbiothrix sp.]|nr:CvpA family protein [Candidatus Symbiothrix sp.]
MNWLDILIIICMAAGLIKGLFDGFVKRAVSFIALIAAIFLAGQIAVPSRNFLLNHVTGNAVSPLIISGICYVLAFVLIIVLITLLGKLISLAIKMTPARPLDILLGGLLGCFIWILSLSILFNVFSVFDVNAMLLSQSTQEKSILYSKVKGVVPTVYPLLKDYFKK